MLWIFKNPINFAIYLAQSLQDPIYSLFCHEKSPALIL